MIIIKSVEKWGKYDWIQQNVVDIWLVRATNVVGDGEWGPPCIATCKNFPYAISPFNFIISCVVCGFPFSSLYFFLCIFGWFFYILNTDNLCVITI